MDIQTAVWVVCFVYFYGDIISLCSAAGDSFDVDKMLSTEVGREGHEAAEALGFIG